MRSEGRVHFPVFASHCVQSVLKAAVEVCLNVQRSHICMRLIRFKKEPGSLCEGCSEDVR